MAFVIAFAGKGGTGKTTIAGLTVRYIIEKRGMPVLAVDADPNNCLHEVLGVDVHSTIGDLREESLTLIRSGSERPGGMSMEQIFDYQVQQSLVESSGFDLMVMGRPEGPGCYCAANNIIRKYTDRLSLSYPYVVIDNEAGMEHLSRRTTQKVDLLLIISDPSVRGLQTARRIRKLVDDLHLEVDRSEVIINRVTGSDMPALKKSAEENGIALAGFIPNDSLIAHFDLTGKPVVQISAASRSLTALFLILDSLNIP